MKLPETWTSGTLGDVIASVRGGFSVQCEDRIAEDAEVGVLKTGAVLTGIFDPTQNKYVPPEEHSRARTPVSANTIIICRKNSEETIGANALVSEDCSNLFLSDLLWELRAAKDTDIHWLSHVLQSGHVRSMIRLWSTGTQSTMKNISQDRLLAIPVSIPRKSEQRKIADILKTWDEAIDKLQALAIAQRTKHSQATNALLLSKESGRRKKTGKRLQQLADVTRELTQRNNGLNLGREFVMGVSNSKGIVPMREQSIGGDLSRYKVLPPRAFAYNPMRINVGSIAMSRLDSCVLVSPDYVLFECVDDRLDPDYLDHLCNTHWWSHHINAGGSGSVRMRTYYDDLAALHLELPDFEEQKKISLYLNAARRENDLIADQINALQRQKRGLMQKLLTGEWRAKC